MTPSNITIDALSRKKLDEDYMRKAIHLAKKGKIHGEVPVGALLVDKNGEILAKAHNLREKLNTTIGHAELIAIHRACQKLQTWRLIECTLYVTLEPCFMCAGALVQSRIQRVVFGAKDPKGGALVSLAELGNNSRLNHSFEVVAGICETECSQILKDFFREKRKSKA